MQKYLDQVYKIFSNVVNCTVESYDLSEFSTDEYQPEVVIRLTLDSGQDTALTEYDEWVDWVVENLDPEEMGHVNLIFTRR